jgi:hypothetical protein
MPLKDQGAPALPWRAHNAGSWCCVWVLLSLVTVSITFTALTTPHYSVVTVP